MTFPSDTVLVNGDTPPRAGDLVLAEVLSLGHHKRLESPHGRRAQLHIGDEIVVAYANRYAPDQFEAEVPADLGDCDLVAAGGIASQLVSRNASTRRPTRIRPIGLIGDRDGTPLNVRGWAMDSRPIPKPLPPVIVVAGTAMNAGKTTTAASLVRGLTRAGKRVGAAKVTGTGAGGDYWQMTDAGAVEVVDFTDAGFASTYLLPGHEVEKIFLRLLSHLGNQRVDVIVVEVADGILQAETADLLSSPGFSYYYDRLVFAAGDAMGAVAGVQWLQARGLDVAAVSGALTAAPLAVREAATALGLPVLTKNQLGDAASAAALLVDADG
ncbi:MAG: molybdopterin-guanine dinucleotide biosynthesis protein MobB [Gammaproteobacteria bacterium]|nr:molybdopterin-guanine dinucleotide biosynthesis protein MobB [Gammaproteobacteria bacterium]